MDIKIIKAGDYGKKVFQEAVWDDIARPWTKYVVKQVPVVVEFLKDKKGLVVDLGCGTGRNMVKQKGLTYYGVDFSSEQLKHAEKYMNKEKIDGLLVKSELPELDKDVFKSSMFDAGLFIAALHCIEGKKERKNATSDFYRVLKKDSEGLISVWNSSDNRFKCVGNSGDIYMSWKEDGKSHMRYYYLYKKDELLRLIRSVGFEVVEFIDDGEDRFSRKNWVVRVRKK